MKICSLTIFIISENNKREENLTLTDREKALCLISNAIASYSLYKDKNKLTQNQSIIDFILKMMPEDIKSDISIDMIDEVFEVVSKTHMELS